MVRSIVVLALVSSGLGAQSLGEVPTVYEFAVAAGSGLTTASAAARRATYIGTSDRLTFGLGARITAMSANGLRLGPTDVLGIATARDTLVVTGTGVTFNIGINAGLSLTPRWKVGMNLDVFGFGSGPSGTGDYYPTPSSAAQPLAAKLASPNMFVGGSGDKGSLNSEFFLAYERNERITFRGGLSHQLIEFKVNPENVASGTARFRKFANLLVVGVRISRAP